MVLIRINGTPTGSRKSSIPLWSVLHLEDFYSPDWFKDWKSKVPSLGCNCRIDFEKTLETFPAVYSDPEGQFFRGIDWHNAVNRKLDRPEITYDHALTLWRHRRPKTGRTKCIVTVATGRKFREVLDVTRPSLKAYALRCDADFIELTNETELWWGFEKFRVRRLIPQYEETLFIDADCVVNPNAPSIFGRTESIAIHDDYRFLSRKDWIEPERRSIEDALGVEFDHRKTCLNSGVVYTRQNAAELWARPSSDLPTSHTAEQLCVEQAAFRLGYSELDSKWNWQFYFPGFWCHVKDSWIVHFATCKDKAAAAKKVLDSWR